MEWNIFLITMGMLMSFGLIGIGVCIGDSMVKGKSDECDSVRLRGVHVPDADNHLDRSDPPDTEEISIVLYNLRIGASVREKAVIDYLLDKEGAENGEK